MIEYRSCDSNIMEHHHFNNKYANYLKKFSHNTHFIVVTHRKGTMEAADVMYGVTMQEQGVSKLISVKFDDV